MGLCCPRCAQSNQTAIATLRQVHKLAENCGKIPEGVEFFDYCGKLPAGVAFFRTRVKIP